MLLSLKDMWLIPFHLVSHCYIDPYQQNPSCCSSAPNSSVSTITISSVKAMSMTVSWGEVPCTGRNGPITGYLLTYTNISVNYTLNITGVGSNRQTSLTALRPYTNYTVRISAYNYGQEGPPSDDVTQETAQSGNSFMN